MTTPQLSFVIPARNEQATLRQLLVEIHQAVSELDRTWEVIFVDDGSDDDSWAVIQSLAGEWKSIVRAIRFRRNLGKAAAPAGFGAARGNVVFTLDADLQDDPREIERFLAKLDEGFDIVTGWKKIRHDPWHKVLPSRVFNTMLSSASQTQLHDHNCGFKCYRAKVVKELVLYGEMHRMVPALGTIRGFETAEIEVTHHPRRFGRSNYGIERFLRGFMDMLTVAFLRKYRERPLHLMGTAAMTFAALGTASVACSLASFTSAHVAVVFATLGACLLASALPLFAIGLLAELMINTLFRSRAPLPIEEEIDVPQRALAALGVSLVEDVEDTEIELAALRTGHTSPERVVIQSTPPPAMSEEDESDDSDDFLLAGNDSVR